MQEFNQRGEIEMGGWVGGIILNFVLSAIPLVYVNFPVYRVENNIGKLVFGKDVSCS